MSEYTIRSGNYVAVVSGDGATLRSLQHGGRQLVVPSRTGEPNPDYRGIIAAPWPNRIPDGRYVFDGKLHELPLNDQQHRSALHGLVFGKEWDLDCHDSSSVVLNCIIEDQSGYPFTLHLSVEYQIGLEGLQITLTAKNIGTSAAPYGACPHPYLVAGPAPLDDWIVHFKADRLLDVTEDRLLPLAECDLRNHEFDFAEPRLIGSTSIDHAFTGIGFDEVGRGELTVRDPSGSGVGMSWDKTCPWVQLHTADRVPPQANRLGLAVEPMTCPPNAFNSGKNLITLLPTQEHRLRCSIYAL